MNTDRSIKPRSKKVFISYARRDGLAFAAKLESVMIQAGYHIWRDKRNLNPSEDFTAAIEQAIADSQWVVVCVTEGTTCPDSFVRREVGYALALGKPVVSLKVDGAIPPINMINFTHVDFVGASFEEALRELMDVLPRAESVAYHTTESFDRYLSELYQKVVGFLEQTVSTSTDLRLQESSDLVIAQNDDLSFDMFGQFFVGHGLQGKQKAARHFGNFSDAFDEYDGRVLLLGPPGSGKTTVLMMHARDAIAARLEKATMPLPLLGAISTWDSETFSSLAHWLASGYRHLSCEGVQRILDRGSAVLLLDGLDELRETRPEDSSNASSPLAVQFIRQLPRNNRIVVSCRTENYRGIGASVDLRGAVELQPLTNEQMQLFFSSIPELLTATKNDDALRGMLATPLLAMLFSRACAELSAADRKQLVELVHDPGELRDAIIQRYVRERYRWEERRMKRQGTTVPFSLAKTEAYLGRLAMENAGSYRRNMNDKFTGRGSNIRENFLLEEDFKTALGDSSQIAQFIAFVRQINVLIAHDSNTFGFAHLLLRDTFAFVYSRDHLLERSLYGRFAEIANPAEALARTGGTRAVGPLVALLKRSDLPGEIAEAVAASCGFTRDSNVVIPLINMLKHQGGLAERAAHSLGRVGDPRAFDPLVDLLKHGSKYARRGAAVGLGWLEDPRAIESLIDVLDHPPQDDAFLLNNVMQALCQLGTPGRDALLKKAESLLSDPYDDFICHVGPGWLLLYDDHRVVEILLKGLSAASNPALKSNAAQALRYCAYMGIGDSRLWRSGVVPALNEALNDSRPTSGYSGTRVCDHATEALDAIKSLMAQRITEGGSEGSCDQPGRDPDDARG